MRTYIAISGILVLCAAILMPEVLSVATVIIGGGFVVAGAILTIDSAISNGADHHPTPNTEETTTDMTLDVNQTQVYLRAENKLQQALRDCVRLQLNDEEAVAWFNQACAEVKFLFKQMLRKSQTEAQRAAA
jgi:hypothetical protein